VFDGLQFGSRGGLVSLSAPNGSIRMLTGSSIDVSGAAGASAGTLQWLAPTGTLQVAGDLKGAGSGANGGGSASFLATSLDMPTLLGKLDAGGFTGALSFHAVGPGDLIVPVQANVHASHLEMIADAGRIDVAGRIDAAAASGGGVTLNASGPISVSGTISARATDEGQHGGRIELASASQTHP
jgi:filamentous hemagglutinin